VKEGIEPLCSAEFFFVIFDTLNSISTTPHKTPNPDTQEPTEVNSSNDQETTLSLAILNSQSLVNKKALLAVFIKDHDPDILVVSETW